MKTFLKIIFIFLLIYISVWFGLEQPEYFWKTNNNAELALHNIIFFTTCFIWAISPGLIIVLIYILFGRK